MISAALLSYGVLKLNFEIDPQIGKLRGIVLGTFGLLAFYLVIYAMLPGLAVGWCYLMASAVAIAVNVIALRFVRQAVSPLVG